MRRQPKFNTFTCFLLSKLSTPKLPFFKTSNPHFLISKLSFIHFKTSFSRFKAPFQPVETLFFSFHPLVSSSPYLVFLISTPILLFLKLIFLISPPSFIHLKSQSQLSQPLFSYHNRFKPVFKNACILVLGIRK